MIVIDLVRSETPDDNIEMISQEILTKKNLWKSFSRYSKEKTRENLRRRKNDKAEEDWIKRSHELIFAAGRKESPLLRKPKRCLPSLTTVETERFPKKSLLRAACRMKIWSECCRKTEPSLCISRRFK